MFKLYRGGKFYWRRILDYPAKTTNLSQITDKLYHIMLYGVHLTTDGIRTHNAIGDYSSFRSTWVHSVVLWDSRRSIFRFLCSVLCIIICHFVFSFSHCIVCSSSIYGFVLTLWYLRSFRSELIDRCAYTYHTITAMILLLIIIFTL